MAIESYVGKYQLMRDRILEWRSGLTVSQKLTLALGMALATGLLGQVVRIHLWFTPVPITGQVFGVLMAGVLLGSSFGALSQLLFLALSICGIPWFGGQGGVHYLVTTCTLGYMLGFILAAFVVGRLTETYGTATAIWKRLAIISVGALMIYIPGAIYFAAYFHTGLADTMTKAVWPFVAVDLVKGMLATGICSAIFPSASRSGQAK